MFSKVAILFAIFAAAHAIGHVGVAYTGSSATSRHQDAHGNYAFDYRVNDGHASTKSQSEVGSGGHKASAYNSHINHVAPAVAVAHAAPLAVGHGYLGAGNLAYGNGIVGGGYLGVGAAPAVAVNAHAAPVAYSSVVNHVAAAPVAVGHGYLGAGNLGYGNGIIGGGYLGAGALAYGNGVAGHGYLGAGSLGYGNGIAGHGLLAH